VRFLFFSSEALKQQLAENYVFYALDTFLGDLAWIDRCALALGIEAPRAVIVSLVSRMRSG
jgi:hypothetical protein